MILAVAVGKVLLDIQPLGLGNVNVDVGQAFSAWADESVEAEIVFDGIDGGDVHQVGHQGATGRSASWADDQRVRITTGLNVLDVFACLASLYIVGDDVEISTKVPLCNDIDL